MAYAVITENDVSSWDDETGAVYHFPNKYKNKILPGTNVLYYKGEIKERQYADNRLSPRPHYFGIAKIGNVKQDPNQPKNYFAEIIEYIPFSIPVLTKKEDGEYWEDVPNDRSNYWRDGVRVISECIFRKVALQGSVTLDLNDLELETAVIETAALPNIEEVFPQISDISLIKKKERKTSGTTDRGNGFVRNSRNAKQIGDRAEKIVKKHLETILSPEEKKTLRWLANEGEKPGYDLVYHNIDGLEICIEVKGTTANLFTDFQITINEWNACVKMREQYFLYLVTECYSKNPKIQILQNVCQMKEEQKLDLEAVLFKVSLYENS